MAEMGETLRPEFALVGPAGSETAGQAQLLIASYSAEQTLDRPVIGKHWKANPATRMVELLHASGVALGLVTNGEHWMLVFAPRGETSGYASWYGSLWLDEPITLRAFHSLLGVRRFFGVAADSTLLGLLKESAQDQQEVTDQLGYQVREAVEVLVQAFDTLDKATGNTLLKGLPETVLYEAALTVMMRLVFLFCAEEQGLLQLGKPLYDDNYAISTLLEQLQEVADQHGEEVLERRFDAWARLLAAFRAVHAGVHHQDLLMPAYGGSLFDPDRYPFLEGRGIGTNWVSTQAEPLAVNNRVALHLLTSLQQLRIKVPGGGPSEARRLSFRALGVEQIGHVYEGLLDHTAVRATDPVLGVKGTRDKETEIPLPTLEATLAQGQDKLMDFLKDQTGRSVSALKRALDEESPYDEHSLLIACGHDTSLLRRIRPFAGLIREDLVERIREVRALLGFTRIESNADFAEATVLKDGRLTPLRRESPTWLPASEVRGEGIFLRIREEMLMAWEAKPEVQSLQQEFLDSHKAWRKLRKIEPLYEDFPGIRLVFLHSLSHALMRQIVLDCGYTAASVRERLYSRQPGEVGGPMAGILLYTAAPDSEGTLGGLVELGDSLTLGRHLQQALESLRLCASDPLCAEHRPDTTGRGIHGACCHACQFAPETSCERGNRYLDRAVLVETFSSVSTCFFE
jgi:hypothetical protein